ncbi:TPA: PRTRC system protein E [Pseudomonas aeruginosa]
MTTTFFTAVSKALTDSNKRISIDLSGLDGGRVKVIVSANIGITPENATDAEKKLRAAIAKPLVLSGTPEEVEAALYARVSAHTEVVNAGMSALDEIRKLGEAAVQAAKPAAKPAAKVPQPSATPAQQRDEEELDDTDLEEGADGVPAAHAAPAAPAESSAFTALAGRF